MRRFISALGLIGFGLFTISGCSSPPQDREPEAPQAQPSESRDETELHSEDFESGQVEGDIDSSAETQSEENDAVAASDSS